MTTIQAIFDAAIVAAITGLCLFATIGCAGRHIDDQFRDSLKPTSSARPTIEAPEFD